MLVVAVAIRAVLEERTLEEGLPGYSGYMERVRYRLIPGVWSRCRVGDAVKGAQRAKPNP